jgi:hypothetical protein
VGRFRRSARLPGGCTLCLGALLRFRWGLRRSLRGGLAVALQLERELRELHQNFQPRQVLGVSGQGQQQRGHALFRAVKAGSSSDTLATRPEQELSTATTAPRVVSMVAPLKLSGEPRPIELQPLACAPRRTIRPHAGVSEEQAANKDSSVSVWFLEFEISRAPSRNPRLRARREGCGASDD